MKTAFLKEGSFARILELTYDRLPSDEQKIMIKLEVAEFAKKIASVDWQAARRDVEHFLYLDDRKFVAQWSEQLFQSQLPQLESLLEERV